LRLPRLLRQHLQIPSRRQRKTVAGLATTSDFGQRFQITDKRIQKHRPAPLNCGLPRDRFMTITWCESAKCSNTRSKRDRSADVKDARPLLTDEIIISQQSVADLLKTQPMRMEFLVETGATRGHSRPSLARAPGATGWEHGAHPVCQRGCHGCADAQRRTGRACGQTSRWQRQDAYGVSGLRVHGEFVIEVPRRGDPACLPPSPMPRKLLAHEKRDWIAGESAGRTGPGTIDAPGAIKRLGHGNSNTVH